jgi:hypothetical protein
VLKAAGLVTERKQANRVLYSLVAERLASSLGTFLSAVCPDRPGPSHRRKKKRPADRASSKDKASTKRKPKAPSRSRGLPPIETPAPDDDGLRFEPGPEQFSAKE